MKNAAISKRLAAIRLGENQWGDGMTNTYPSDPITAH